MDQPNSSSLAEKLPPQLKQKLADRQFNYKTHSSSRVEQVADRRSRLLELRQLRFATHNQRVHNSRAKNDLRQELRSFRIAKASEERHERAQERRKQRIADTVARAAAQNEATREHATHLGLLREAKQQNKMLRHLHAQLLAGKRRRDLELLKSQAAAVHNERVALTKDYVRISDYIEEVSDDDEYGEGEVEEGKYLMTERQGSDSENQNVQARQQNNLNGFQRRWLTRGFSGEEDLENEDVDQWSNVANIGDEESLAELSFQTRGSSNGHGSGDHVNNQGNNNWNVGRSLILSAHTPFFRRQLAEKYRNFKSL